MSQRFLLEFNTDYHGDWPDEVRDMFDTLVMGRSIGMRVVMRSYRGIEIKHQRHHTSPCPTERSS